MSQNSIVCKRKLRIGGTVLRVDVTLDCKVESRLTGTSLSSLLCKQNR
jgi:hypothetical protein